MAIEFSREDLQKIVDAQQKIVEDQAGRIEIMQLQLVEETKALYAAYTRIAELTSGWKPTQETQERYDTFISRMTRATNEADDKQE